MLQVPNLIRPPPGVPTGDAGAAVRGAVVDQEELPAGCVCANTLVMASSMNASAFRKIMMTETSARGGSREDAGAGRFGMLAIGGHSQSWR